MITKIPNLYYNNNRTISNKYSIHMHICIGQIFDTILLVYRSNLKYMQRKLVPKVKGQFQLVKMAMLQRVWYKNSRTSQLRSHFGLNKSDLNGQVTILVVIISYTVAEEIVF